MALYRKYRPATFAEVVGQEHVTEPLSTALDSGRINHAYLFSGPRGCGKTSSARILARSLNCEQGPTSSPCGECASCRALAPGGPGTLDVTELDAATHNGVEDMRELRDRAFYAPADSRYRVFIIDEAHMISSAGFNALLKIVEEPPEHLIFIFATTEPEKLLQTIRSRTHNYPFRLLTPPAMRGLLGRVCEEEGAVVEDAVYPLVIRAGGGSPRDSLSIMDQLLAGAGEDGVTYGRAVALLGFTDTSLIDRAVDALANQDQAGLFGCVSDVIDAGHDPRRFAMDLLDRFRDLLVVQAVPDAFDTGLVDAPVDQRDVLTAQAQAVGQATLTRCASLVNEGLAQMRGATAPRLLLEILCARMSLPAAGMTVEALAQRVEALEAGGGAGAAPSGGGRPYVRKSRREAEAARQAPAPAPESAAPEPETPVSQAAPAAPSAPAASAAPESRSAVPEQAAPAARAQPQESPEDARRAEAERAREIMRRRRRPSGGEAAGETAGEAPGETVGQPVETPAGPPQEPSSQEAPAPAAAPEPTPEPAPEPASEPARVGEPRQEPATAEQAAHPVGRWPEILEAVKEANLAAWIAARDATAQEGPEGDDGVATISLTHHTGALANYINAPEHAPVYSDAAEKVTGAPVRISAGVGGKYSPESPGKAEAAVDPQPEPAPQEKSGHTGVPVAQDPAPSDPAPQGQAPSDPVDLALQRARQMESPAATSPAATSPAPRAEMPDSRQQTAPAQSPAQSPAKKREQEEQLSGWRARRARIDARRGSGQADNREQASGFNGVPLPEEPAEPWDDGPGATPPDPEGPQGVDMAEAEEAMAQLDDPSSANIDRRSAIEIAGELLEKHLGAERTR
ncbi:DNA polymerase III subunit gamma and tau [Corynebacterium sp.]|uniref:DNA polymerase III subunit gamma and tau n=1 Tax=Corynebacterium sp. TaxID=1720 RepID=UPI0025BE48BC|nr:DNA polymerase III subunit gamma and tau [Corynebacterium sp.]